MKKKGVPFILVASVLLICLAVVLAYISLLGENNKVEDVVDNFFDKIQTQQYFTAKENANVVESRKVFDIGGNYAENCMLLELALLKNYHIHDIGGYEVKIDKSGFWIPFLRSPDVQVSVALKDPVKWHFLSMFKKKKKAPPYIRDLFTVTRKDGGWLISAIHLKHSPLMASVRKLKGELALGDLVTRRGSIIAVKPIKIDTEHISTVERRKLDFVFQKLNQIVNAAGRK